MTLECYCGFDSGEVGDDVTYDLLQQRAGNWNTSGSTVVAKVVEGEAYADDGGKAMGFDGITPAINTTIGVGIDGTYPIYVSCMVRFTATGGSTYAPLTIGFQAAGVGLYFKPNDGSITTTFPTMTGLASGAVVGQWYHVEVYLSFPTGTSWIKIDGVQQDSTTTAPNVNWHGVSNNNISLTRSSTGAYACPIEIDHLVINTEDGTAPSGPMGSPLRIFELVPGTDQTQDPTPASGTDRYAMIDQTTPDVAQYNSYEADGDIGSYGLQFDPGAPTIHGVIVKQIASLESGSHDAITVMGVADTQVGTSWTPAAVSSPDLTANKQVFTTNPLTASAWTGAEIATLKVGLEQVAQ